MWEAGKQAKTDALLSLWNGAFLQAPDARGDRLENGAVVLRPDRAAIGIFPPETLQAGSAVGRRR